MPERNELLRQTINKLLLLHSTHIKGDQRKKERVKRVHSTVLYPTYYIRSDCIFLAVRDMDFYFEFIFFVCCVHFCISIYITLIYPFLVVCNYHKGYKYLQNFYLFIFFYFSLTSKQILWSTLRLLSESKPSAMLTNCDYILLSKNAPGL